MSFIILLNLSKWDTKQQKWRKYKRALNHYNRKNRNGEGNLPKPRKFHRT